MINDNKVGKHFTVKQSGTGSFMLEISPDNQYLQNGYIKRFEAITFDRINRSNHKLSTSEFGVSVKDLLADMNNSGFSINKYGHLSLLESKDGTDKLVIDRNGNFIIYENSVSSNDYTPCALVLNAVPFYRSNNRIYIPASTIIEERKLHDLFLQYLDSSLTGYNKDFDWEKISSFITYLNFNPENKSIGSEDIMEAHVYNCKSRKENTATIFNKIPVLVDLNYRNQRQFGEELSTLDFNYYEFDAKEFMI